MYDSKIESCIEFITSGTDCGEDSETVEETLLEIKELQKKYEFIIQELLDKALSSDAETLCSHLSKLIFKIRKTTSAYRKYKKELVSAPQSNQTNNISKETFDKSSYQTHTDASLTTNIFSAPAEYSSYSESFPNNAAPSSLMGDSNTILPPVHLSQHLTTTSADVSGTSTISNALSGVTFGGFNSTSTKIDGAFASIHVSHQAAQTSPLNPPIRTSQPSFTLPTVGIVPQTPTSMSSFFQKSVPKLQATKFDGDPLSWLKWFSVFQATIDRSPKSSAEKMIHLQSLLIGEAKALVDGYGCNGSLYSPALARLEEYCGKPNRIVNAFLEKLSHFRPPNLTIPDSFTQFSSFLLTLVDKFQQLGFNHHKHSTTNVNRALNKLPTPVRLEWNKHVLERRLLQPSLKEISEWLLIYAKACRDLPTSCASAQPPSTHSKDSNNLSKQSNQQNQFYRPSNRSHQDQRTNPSNSFQPSSAKSVVCPNNGSCQYLYKFSHFQDLSPLDRREHEKKLKLCFNCFGSLHVQQCTSKNVFRLQTAAKSTTQCSMKFSLQKIKQYDPLQQLNRFNCMAQFKLLSNHFNCLTGRKRLRHMLISTTEVARASSSNPQL